MTKQERDRMIKALIKSLLLELDNKEKDELIGILEGIMLKKQLELKKIIDEKNSKSRR